VKPVFVGFVVIVLLGLAPALFAQEHDVKWACKRLRVP
jgi:hypothetical protein